MSSPETKQKNKSYDKHLSSNTMSKLERMKVTITWVIVIAFIATSGLMISKISRGGGQDEENQKRQQAVNPIEQAKKRVEADIKNWQAEIGKEPKNPHNHFNLGMSFMEAGKFDDAIASFKEALKISPGDAMYMKHLAIAYEANKQPEESLKVVQEAIKKNPTDDSLYRYAGSLYYQKKNYKESEKMFQLAKKNNPGEVLYYLYLAQAQKESGNKKAAKKTIREGIEVAKSINDPRKSEALEAFSKTLDEPSVPSKSIKIKSKYTANGEKEAKLKKEVQGGPEDLEKPAEKTGEVEKNTKEENDSEKPGK